MVVYLWCGGSAILMVKVMVITRIYSLNIENIRIQSGFFSSWKGCHCILVEDGSDSTEVYGGIVRIDG